RPSSRLSDSSESSRPGATGSRNLAQRREPVHRCAASYHSMSRLGFQNPVFHRMLSLGHVATCCPCSSITSKYSGMGEFAQLVDLLQRIYAFMCGHLRHQPIAIARNALQRHAEHPVHLAVGLSGLKEANAAIVGVTDQPRKLVLSQLAPPDRSWSRCQRRAASP